LQSPDLVKSLPPRESLSEVSAQMRIPDLDKAGVPFGHIMNDSSANSYLVANPPLLIIDGHLPGSVSENCQDINKPLMQAQYIHQPGMFAAHGRNEHFG
jgi:hypothetical protein